MTKPIRLPPRDLIMALLHYDPLTGIFIWLLPPDNHSRLIGTVAGGRRTGYVMIRIRGTKYKAHRLAWLYVYGVEPPTRIDHEDGNPFNNSISNLRSATQAQNIANATRRFGKLLPKGVRKSGKRFIARISFEGQLRTIGTFNTPQEAAAAYLNEAKRLYGQFARAA